MGWAIAIPAFIGYVRRSKTSEVPANLKSLYEGAATYYSTERNTMQGIVAASAQTNCVVDPAGPIPMTPTDQKQQGAFTTNDSFRALGFNIDDPVYYSYEFAAMAGCGVRGAVATSIYSFRASGDLDGDMATSFFELSAGINNDDEMFRAPGFFVLEELE